MRKTPANVATPAAHLVGPGCIKVVNGKLAFASKDHSPLRLDPKALESLICYGRVGISDRAFELLFKHGVEVAWMTPSGSRCHGRMAGVDDSKALVRFLQHRVLGVDALKLELAREIVRGKVESQLEAARHYQRQGRRIVRQTCGELSRLRDAVKRARSVDSLRGYEGSASAAWFCLFGALLQKPWVFRGRRMRPPPDPVNALLSLGYTWLHTRVVGKCRAAGMECAFGALHQFRPGRLSLACDLMEPLRVPCVDRWVIQVCNGRVLSPDRFHAAEGRVRLADGAFGDVLASWETFWHKGRHGWRMDQLVTRFVRRLRELSGGLPDSISGAKTRVG